MHNDSDANMVSQHIPTTRHQSSCITNRHLKHRVAVTASIKKLETETENDQFHAKKHMESASFSLIESLFYHFHFAFSGLFPNYGRLKVSLILSGRRSHYFGRCWSLTFSTKESNLGLQHFDPTKKKACIACYIMSHIVT